MHPAKPRGGFTLIEMVMVVALIGLLLSIAVPRYFHTLDQAKAQVQQQNLATLRDAIDKYFGDRGRYPDTLDDLVKQHYLRSIPVDPLTGKPDWTVRPPEDTQKGMVYDVASAHEEPKPQ
ncbi:type II secretion system protein [Noviherbaspirillum pedocola]|uniref:Prepilin-type N-terminal cleavage/methylation domain-containing protein n=1 Tax=Noviherbaspirillum pedocola TaxID=2801341 RepID=A0A934W7N9_9BURK|nr:prepilin-type N-terminal cleavage/methylation domain-containing protein [Noviherbaspirillum pedocola]MBK4735823.1 prepilin-type N-terminal cleavage/methylation domain-containing protein [Noviherbaspirillum pedocola]